MILFFLEKIQILYLFSLSQFFKKKFKLADIGFHRTIFKLPSFLTKTISQSYVLLSYNDITVRVFSKHSLFLLPNIFRASLLFHDEKATPGILH